jgi:hypothetical protein
LLGKVEGGVRIWGGSVRCIEPLQEKYFEAGVPILFHLVRIVSFHPVVCRVCKQSEVGWLEVEDLVVDFAVFHLELYVQVVHGYLHANVVRHICRIRAIVQSDVHADRHLICFGVEPPCVYLEGGYVLDP